MAESKARRAAEALLGLLDQQRHYCPELQGLALHRPSWSPPAIPMACCKCLPSGSNCWKRSRRAMTPSRRSVGAGTTSAACSTPSSGPRPPPPLPRSTNGFSRSCSATRPTARCCPCRARQHRPADADCPRWPQCFAGVWPEGLRKSARG